MCKKCTSCGMEWQCEKFMVSPRCPDWEEIDHCKNCVKVLES